MQRVLFQFSFDILTFSYWRHNVGTGQTDGPSPDRQTDRVQDLMRSSTEGRIINRDVRV